MYTARCSHRWPSVAKSSPAPTAPTVSGPNRWRRKESSSRQLPERTGSRKQASNRTSGYSVSELNTVGATITLNTPPRAPPSDTKAKNCVSWEAAGRSAASSPCMASATAKKVARWTPTTSQRGSLIPMTTIPASTTTSGGIAYSAPRCQGPAPSPREKTRMNETRYRDSGNTHRRGIGARLVVIAEVAPSIRLEGTNASATQRARRPAPMRCAGSRSAARSATAGGRRERHITIADALSSSASSA